MKKTVLIVDDSASLRQVVNLALSRAGYDVIEGCDGQDGLARLDGRKVHLIVSDVNMPRMDGLTFLKSVKALPNYRFTPVIMLTTETSDARKDAGRAAGARAWIVKPFNPPVLLEAVAKLCLP
jgi:two-component system, chemotaxis family, chemotaxis protein CheY